MKDAVLYNVLKEDGEWWMGELDGNVGWFPSNYVEEIDHAKLITEEKEDSDNMLGSMEKDFLLVKDLKFEAKQTNAKQQLLFVLTDSTGKSVECSVETTAELTTWQTKIKEAVKEAKRERRKTKIPKGKKKRLVAKTTGKK